MNEFCGIAEHGARTALDEILDRLDVVIGLGFDRLDLSAVFDAEGFNELVQRARGVVRPAGSSGRPSAASPVNHATSTRRRSRMKANSEKMSRSSRV